MLTRSFVLNFVILIIWYCQLVLVIGDQRVLERYEKQLNEMAKKKNGGKPVIINGKMKRYKCVEEYVLIDEYGSELNDNKNKIQESSPISQSRSKHPGFSIASHIKKINPVPQNGASKTLFTSSIPRKPLLDSDFSYENETTQALFTTVPTNPPEERRITIATTTPSVVSLATKPAEHRLFGETGNSKSREPVYERATLWDRMKHYGSRTFVERPSTRTRGRRPFYESPGRYRHGVPVYEMQYDDYQFDDSSEDYYYPQDRVYDYPFASLKSHRQQRPFMQKYRHQMYAKNPPVPLVPSQHQRQPALNYAPFSQPRRPNPNPHLNPVKPSILFSSDSKTPLMQNYALDAKAAATDYVKSHPVVTQQPPFMYVTSPLSALIPTTTMIYPTLIPQTLPPPPPPPAPLQTTTLPPPPATTFKNLQMSPENCQRMNNLSASFGISNPRTWVRHNCALAQAFAPQATCADLNAFVDSCYIHHFF